MQAAQLNENSAFACDTVVAAVTNEYNQKCLDPLENCIPTAGAQANFDAVNDDCQAASETLCNEMLDCSWSEESMSCAASRTARWIHLCGHVRTVCPRGPGCVRESQATDDNPACWQPECGCDESQQQWCQSIFNMIIQNCGTVPVAPDVPDSSGANANSLIEFPMRNNTLTGELESYADWPFVEERSVLGQMGCNTGPFAILEGLGSFDAESVAVVCYLGMTQMASYCGCGINDDGSVQSCDPNCVTLDCQHRFATLRLLPDTYVL